MSDTARHGLPYVWVTWILALCSGEASCEWAAWFKARYKYDKLLGDNNLSQWQAEHAEMVRARVTVLQADGWAVSVEKQNKFTLEGRAVVLSGQADILAVRGDEALVEDCKTGARKEKDFWQVVTYCYALPRCLPSLLDKRLSGAVVYRDGRREVSAHDAKVGEAILHARLRSVGGERPARTPSLQECRWCDIASCTDRVTDEAVQAQTEDF